MSVLRLLSAKWTSLICITFVHSCLLGQSDQRARDLGIPFDGEPGKFNAITDVPGVLVGHHTLIFGDDSAAVRTGVTAILPSKTLREFNAATHVLGGDAEISGQIFAEDFGYLRTPIVLTGTASNGTVYTSIIKWSLQYLQQPILMPMVADTWDGYLSNYKIFPLNEAHVFEALNSAKSGVVEEGSVGGGTGMFCYDFKAGIGTASRVLTKDDGGFTVGVLVQSNHGDRRDLTISGVPVGKELKDNLPILEEGDGSGSIIIVVATDAPVGPGILKGMARRSMLGLARTGAMASPYSGDVSIAFSTKKYEWEMDENPIVKHVTELDPYEAGPLYQAVIQATEEAIVNSLVAGRTMVGWNGSKVYGMDIDKLLGVLRKYKRMD